MKRLRYVMRVRVLHVRAQNLYYINNYYKFYLFFFEM